MKKTWIWLVVGFLIVLVLYVLNAINNPKLEENHTLKKQLETLVHNNQTESDIQLTLKDWTDFEWDTVLIFSPYSNPQHYFEQHDLKWNSSIPTHISYTDGISLLVFMNGAQTVSYVEHPRSAGDFAFLESVTYTKEQANFSVIYENEFPTIVDEHTYAELRLDTEGDDQTVPVPQEYPDQKLTHPESGLTIEGRFNENEGYMIYHTLTLREETTINNHWRNSLLREPIVYMAELNDDPYPDILIVNIVDHGTGIVVTEPHVIDSVTLQEISVEPLQDIVTNRIHFHNHTELKEVMLDEQVIFSSHDENLGAIDARFAESLQYGISDNQLIGSVRIGDGSYEGTIGYIDVHYTFRDQQLIGDSVEFRDDMRSYDLSLEMDLSHK